MIRAFVGSGGKTGTIMRQAQAAREQGLTVLVTTSTQMGAREGTIVGDDPKPIIDALAACGYAMAGQAANRPRKIAALSEETFALATKHADLVLVEADGSRQHQLKFPASHEPVIPHGTDEIVVICGLSAIGQKAKDVCHRMELVKVAIGIGEETVITAKHVQQLVDAAYLEPLCKAYPDARITLYPCQRDTLYLRAVAALMMAQEDVNLIQEEWFDSVTAFGNGAFVLEIILDSEDGKGVGRMRSLETADVVKPQLSKDNGTASLLIPIERWKVTK